MAKRTKKTTTTKAAMLKTMAERIGKLKIDNTTLRAALKVREQEIAELEDAVKKAIISHRYGGQN